MSCPDFLRGPDYGGASSSGSCELVLLGSAVLALVLLASAVSHLLRTRYCSSHRIRTLILV